MMKLKCDFTIAYRPSAPMKRPKYAQLSLGHKPTPSNSSDKTREVFLLVCTAGNLVGDRYAVKDNILQIFHRFAHEGKMTIQLKTPEIDLILSKCEPLVLKCFLNVLKSASQGLELKKEELSLLSPSSSKAMTKPARTLSIYDKKKYPVNSGFPGSLDELRIIGCGLKRFDSRIHKLKFLTCLNLDSNALTDIPVEICNLGLKTLILRRNKIKLIHDSVFTGALCRNLNELDLSENALQFLPRTLIGCKGLVNLKLGCNELKCLPFGFAMLKDLEYVYLSRNHLQALPADFARVRWKELDVHDNPLDKKSCIHVERLGFPNLLELSARTIKNCNIEYSLEDLPRSLYEFMDQGKRCLCGSYCFQTYVKCTLGFDLRKIASSVVQLPSGGYVARVDNFVCSWKCYRRLEKDPMAL